MSVPSLDLFPVRRNEPIKLGDGKQCFSFGAMLSIEMTRDLLKALVTTTDGQNLPDYSDFLIEGAEDYGTMEWVPARVLKSLVLHPDVEGRQLNRATWAYFGVLDDDTPVGMYWAF